MSKDTMMKQYQLQLVKKLDDEDNTATHIITWLESGKTKVGDTVTLKDKDGEWKVVQEYDVEQTKKWLEDNKKFDNDI